jgi:uncharacterized protein (TIGR02466 family)
MDTLSETHYFQSPVYVVNKPEFLDSVQKVSVRYQQMSDSLRVKPTTLMTPSYSHEEELKDFSEYVSQTAWNILASQGYFMDDNVTYFTEMWTQEHNQNSYMETHVHGYGSQITAFYFIDAPENSCKFVIHDPRPGKVIVNLPEKDHSAITMGSRQIVFTPQAGTLIFTNSWLPHSFTRSYSEEPMRFVHMNLSVAPSEAGKVEVI